MGRGRGSCRTVGAPILVSSVSQDQWRLLSDSLVLIDPSVSTYDVIHISRDIATNPDRTRDWCLLGNHSVTFSGGVQMGAVGS